MRLFLFGILISVLTSATGTAVYAQQPSGFMEHGRGAEMSATRTPHISGSSQACTAIKNALTTRSTQLDQTITHITEVMDSLIVRVDGFYQAHVVAKGNTVANYDALKAATETNKTAVLDALTALKTAITDLTCDVPPYTIRATIGVKMRALSTAIKNYRTSVRNLIVAVHKATPDDASQGATVTPAAVQ